MKKNLFSVFAVCALALFAFSSCKKDYTCTCKVALNPILGGGAGITFDTTFVVKFDDMKKKEAKAACKGSEEAFKQLGSGLLTVDCDI